MKKLFKNVLAFGLAASLAVGSTVVASAAPEKPSVFTSEFSLKWEKVDFAAELATAYKAQPEYFYVNVDEKTKAATLPSTVIRQADVEDFHAYLEAAAQTRSFAAFNDDRLKVLLGNGTYVAVYKATLNTDVSTKAPRLPEHYILATSKNAKDWTIVGSFYERVFTSLGLANGDPAYDNGVMGVDLVYTNGNFFLGANKYAVNWTESYLLKSTDGLNWNKAYVAFPFEILDPERKINGDLGLKGTGDIHIVSTAGGDTFKYPVNGTYSPVDASLSTWKWATTTEEAYFKLTNDHVYKYGDGVVMNATDVFGLYDAALLDVMKVYMPSAFFTVK